MYIFDCGIMMLFYSEINFTRRISSKTKVLTSVVLLDEANGIRFQCLLGRRTRRLRNQPNSHRL